MAEAKNVSFDSIMADLEARRFAPVYYLMGEESYYIDKISDYIAEHVLQPEERDFNQTVLFGSDVTASQVADYARRYPGSDRAETAYFMSLNAIFNVSPLYSLDQTDTYYAIEEIKSFIIQYPESKHIEECNIMLDKLNNKLAKKDFEILKLYYNTYSYEATQIAAKNFFKTFPYCPYVPEAMYILVQNNYKYAKNSVAAKQAARYQACIDAYEMLSANYPESTYIADAQKLATDAQKQIDRINSSKKQ